MMHRPISSVWPSGVALATCAAPKVAPAPGLFSTITGWPMAEESLVDTARASTSVVPPAGNGTTMVTVLVGQAWAEARLAAPHRAAIRVLRVKVSMVSPAFEVARNPFGLGMG